MESTDYVNARKRAAAIVARAKGADLEILVGAVLVILETEEWSADALDAIAQVAHVVGLADADGPQFRIAEAR